MHSIFINKQVDRVLALGLLLLVIASAYAFIQHVYLAQIKSLNSEIEIKKKRNAKIDSILKNEKAVKSEIAKQTRINRKNKIFLSGKKPATAASELQNYMKRLIATYTKATIVTIKPYPVIEHDDYSEASLEIRLKDVGHKGLHNVLFRIESNAPVLIMRELDIKLTQLRYKTVVEASEEKEKLAVTMVISGFYRGLAGQI